MSINSQYLRPSGGSSVPPIPLGGTSGIMTIITNAAFTNVALRTTAVVSNVPTGQESISETVTVTKA